MDAACHPHAVSAVCEIRADTGSFSLMSYDGTYAPLDEQGNRKVKTALKKATKKTGLIPAAVQGKLVDQVLYVDFVQVQ
jgi:hypothetical protein